MSLPCSKQRPLLLQAGGRMEASSSEDEFDAGDDEEIDEDEAFNQSDWQQYGEFFPNRDSEDSGDSGADEGESDYEDDEDGDGMEGRSVSPPGAAEQWLEGSAGGLLAVSYS
jgi:hypothetical protein